MNIPPNSQLARILKARAANRTNSTKTAKPQPPVPASAATTPSPKVTAIPIHLKFLEPTEPPEFINDDPVFYTVDAATYLGVSSERLQKWRQRGQGPDFLRYEDGGIRYELSALVAYRAARPSFSSTAPGQEEVTTMITRTSALFYRRTRQEVFTDDLRGQTLVRLIGWCRLLIEDLAQALNCSESIIRSLLSRQYQSLPPLEGTDIASSTEAIDLRMAAHHKSFDSVELRPSTPDEKAGQQEKHARDLALEIRRWLCTFEVSDADRQRLIELAGFLLDESPVNAAGDYVFDIGRVYFELRGIWGKSARSINSPDLVSSLSQWLASWIRFWITDPAIWNRALDLEFAHFGANAQAA